MEDYDKNDYEIYYSHQCDKRPFNRGAMKNIGFLAMKAKYPNDYKNITFVFNDVDTLPYTKNLLKYDTSEGIIKHFYGFRFALGGIFSIKGQDFERINGFPNFWAWGYEDNLLLERVTQAKINIDRSTFFPFADKNILHFYDGYVKQVNKNEFQRYNNRTREGIHSIFKLVYHKNNNTGLMDITSFETGTDEHKQSTRMHDLRNSTTPFTGARSNRRSTMSLLL